MKRGRQEDEQKYSGTLAGRQQESDHLRPNQFGQWLLENIYKYAEVRDSEGLAALRKELKRTKRKYEALRLFAWEVVLEKDFEQYPNFCNVCGNTCVRESRTVCSRCCGDYAPCKQCEPRSCASKRHLLCDDCVEEEKEDDDGVVCNGRYESECDFEQ